MPGSLASESLDQCVRYTTDQVTVDLTGLMPRALARGIARQMACQVAPPWRGMCAPCGAQNLVPTRSMAWLMLFAVEWIFMCSTGSSTIQGEGPLFEVANHCVYRLHSLPFSRDDPIEYRSRFTYANHAAKSFNV